MRVVEKPGGIEIRGKDFRIVDAKAEVARAPMTMRVRHTRDFDRCNELEQRMLLSVAEVADKYGIASGWDEKSRVARGVGVPELALKAGLDRDTAQWALDRLCDRETLVRLTAPHPPHGPVWVLLNYED